MALVLIAEDRPEIQTLLEAVVGRAGHQTVIAGSAEEAAALLGQGPALAFVDLGLPDQSGLDLARQIRGFPATQGIPIVFITAHPDGAKQVREAFFQNAEVVMKPFRFNAVLGIIEKYLG